MCAADGEDMEKVWCDHVRDREVLATYSQAMHSLATGPWREREEGDRIQWCVQTCNEYWDHRLEKLLLKDLRRVDHDMPPLVHSSLLPPSPPGVRSLVEGLQGEPVKLLDVGSCYNPFLSFTQFSVTAIDIAPASEVLYIHHTSHTAP